MGGRTMAGRMMDRAAGCGREPAAILRPRQFDLRATLNSGQVFHWSEVEPGRFTGTIGSRRVEILLRDDGGLEVDASQQEAVSRYLSLDHPMDEIIGSFPPGDEALRQAVAFCPGLRIIRQPAWECLATFITSSLKQVSHIRQISLLLRREFGRPLGAGQWAYPVPEALAAAGEEALRRCGLGYRAPLLWSTACLIAREKFSLGFLDDPEVPQGEAVARLCALPGVGPKIAHCVLLFAGGRHGCFPVDVWVERVMRELYASQTAGLSRRGLEEFVAGHFGPWAGYAQQFLFHHARLTFRRAVERPTGSGPVRTRRRGASPLNQ